MTVSRSAFCHDILKSQHLIFDGFVFHEILNQIKTVNKSSVCITISFEERLEEHYKIAFTNLSVAKLVLCEQSLRIPLIKQLAQLFFTGCQSDNFSSAIFKE